MAATAHLLTGPPGPHLTRRLLAEYLPRARAVPGSALWLSPCPAAADEVRRLVVACGRPVLVPNILTLEAFARSVLAAPGRVNNRLLAEGVVAELSKGGRLGYFRRVAGTRGFLDGVSGLLHELEVAGVTPDALTAAVGRGRAGKLKACAELFAAASKAGLPESPVARAADRVRAGLPAPYRSIRSVFLDGFQPFTPVEWALIEALTAHVELWIAVPEDANRDGAFAGVRQARARLSAASATTLTPPERPAGLAHLARHLFGPDLSLATDAAGVHLVEAPGHVGEARLVARRIRSLIASGVKPADIVATARDLTYSRDLLGEVFAEYGIPTDLAGDDSLLRNPAVGTLLRGVRLPDDGWPFPAVTALLRSTYFRPAWPEAAGDTPRRADGLLRLLGEPRDRDAYLRAVRVWAETPPDGLEDEQAEESRRLRKARLAADCRPFLERFFRAWDGCPGNGPAAGFVGWLRGFARDIGLEAAADEGPADRAALRAFFAALDRPDERELSRTAFVRRVASVAASEPQPGAPPTAGRVRVVPAEDARHLQCDYLFVLGLGEGSFPRLGPPTSLLDDADRNALRTAGLDQPDPAARLGDEQLLFLQLVARPRVRLVLSYPAVDEKGQPLLPGTFLRAARDLFAPGALPVERQRMLIEGYATREPFSAAEARVQFALAAHGKSDGADWRHPALPADLCEHLCRADGVATARFRSDDYNRFDGWLESPVARVLVADRFGPDRVFSPTALEAYVACPFRFLMEHVLRLEELEEPGEEVEHTRRGAAYHRALARLHRRLGESDPEMTRSKLPDHVGPELLAEIDKAVQEYANRAPSPASRKLWELEGRRLHRSAERYRGHWDEFLDPWREKKTHLAPQLLEADFGLTPAGSRVQSSVPSAGVAPLVISVGGVEVRIGGRIDRVDVAELPDGIGFWVIDYKTGRAANYTAADLNRFEKLQLSLYALAVERVLLHGRSARPLGLAYWLVTDTGPKPVLPGRQSLAWLADPKKWTVFREQLEAWVAKVVDRLREGQFPLAPRSDHCTDTCRFGQVCRISQSRNVGKVWELTLPGEDTAAAERH